MKADPRTALFGGSYTEEGLGSVSRNVRAEHASIYVFTVTVGNVLTLNLPNDHRRDGFQFLVWNKGAGGTGTISMISGTGVPVALIFLGPAGGTEELAPGDVAKVFWSSAVGWIAYAYTAGPRSVLS